MLEKPAFLQGIFSCAGLGLHKPLSFQPPATYQVPSDKRAQIIYLRAGNSRRGDGLPGPYLRRKTNALLPHRRKGGGPRSPRGA